MDFFNVVSVDEAKKITDYNFKYKMERERISILEASGRILYEDIVSHINVPDFRRSTVDGYAVCSKDVFGASEAMPAIMELKGDVLMGKTPEGSIDFPGECFYVPTGGMLPEGADGVVMIEYTEKLDDNTILINSSIAPGDNVVEIGEDIRYGEVVINGGTKLRPYEIGVLSSLGYDMVEVFKKPKVGIISTGDEIVNIDENPKSGQIRDINTYLLYSSVIQDGGEPVIFGLIKDDYRLLEDTVTSALSECDIVLISGGSSVGKKDETLNVINSLGKVLVHGISIKPGKPTIIGKAGDRIIFGLPGHPMSCSVIYNIIVKYYLHNLMRYSEEICPIPCRFDINYHKAKGREEYLPVTLKEAGGQIIASPVFGKSGLITALSKAWGYIRIDKNIEGIREGEIVYVYKF